ncbi:MAG: HDOD domain-containing protein [Rhodocyclaceae bacterium]|nr:HDOD domain-containing protein [Rhodocyclaceae bacterium]
MDDMLERQMNELAESIGAELASGKINFPTFLEASLRIKERADDPDVSLQDIAALIQAEPVLSARVIKMANSALLNPGGKAITAIGPAVIRIGLLPIRTLAFVVSTQQLENDLRSPSLRATASALWMHSVDVATRAHVLARHFKVCPPDKALLVAMLRSVGEFYLIARIAGFPEFAAEPERVSDFVSTWREPVGAALLEAFELPPEILESVEDGSLYGGLWPPTDLGDLLFIAALSAEAPNPFDLSSPEERQAVLQGALHGSGHDELTQLLQDASDERGQLVTSICG